MHIRSDNIDLHVLFFGWPNYFALKFRKSIVINPYTIAKIIKHKPFNIVTFLNISN